MGVAMNRPKTAKAWTAGVSLIVAITACAVSARAQDFTHDGYTADGAYAVNVELTPHAFLRHVATDVNGIGPRGRGGISGNISA